MKSKVLVSAHHAYSLVALGLLLPLTFSASAQNAPNEDQKRQANANVVTIVASAASSTYTRFAEDIQYVLDDTGRDGLRVLPMLGRGGGQNFNDILFVKGVDIGTTDAEYMRYYQKLDPKLYANVNQRVQYIAKLFNAEFHVLAPRSIGSIQDLRGRKVNFWKPASISALAAEVVFGTLGIPVEPTYDDNRLAIEKLKSGEIAGVVRHERGTTRRLRQHNGSRRIPSSVAGRGDGATRPVCQADGDLHAVATDPRAVSAADPAGTDGAHRRRQHRPRGLRLAGRLGARTRRLRSS